MKQSIWMVVIVGWFSLYGCSLGPMGGQDGVAVVFDSDPRLYDSSVVFMGMPVGEVLSDTDFELLFGDHACPPVIDHTVQSV